jgi:D-glycero-D-manno-heptose 1,7-bisphosphate phosphatase
MNKPRPAVFLDRDGTINVEKEYLHRVEDWEWIPGSVDAIRRLNQLEFLVIVVTNQAGIARGYYTEHAVVTLHEHVDRMLAASGARIDAYYYCPHHVDYGATKDCACRKPRSGMLLSAQKEWSIDLDTSFLVGDKLIDIQAAQAVGVTPIMVRTGYGGQESKLLTDEVVVAEDLLNAVQTIENELCRNLLGLS